MSAPPALATQLLRNSLGNIGTYGFTMRCIQASNPDIASPSALSALFPGPDSASTSAPRRLFAEWDRHALETVLPGEEGREVRFRPVTDKEERERYGAVVQGLERRLWQSWLVRDHLVDSLSNESRQPIKHIFPFSDSNPINFSSFPTPLPLVSRSQHISGTILSHPSLQYSEADGPQWYATRARLAFAYLVAELHVAGTAEVAAVSPEEAWDRSRSFLHRVAHGRDTSVVHDALKLRADANKWVKWGGRGWVGTLRSWGL